MSDYQPRDSRGNIVMVGDVVQHINGETWGEVTKIYDEEMYGDERGIFAFNIKSPNDERDALAGYLVQAGCAWKIVGHIDHDE